VDVTKQLKHEFMALFYGLKVLKYKLKLEKKMACSNIYFTIFTLSLN